MNFQDRVSAFPGRYRSTPVPGQPGIVDLERADQPVAEGTRLDREFFTRITYGNAVGETTGTANGLLLSSPGFNRADGARVLFRNHVAITSAAQLNVENTGMAPIQHPWAEPNAGGSTVPAGTWFLVTWSQTRNAWIGGPWHTHVTTDIAPTVTQEQAEGAADLSTVYMWTVDRVRQAAVGGGWSMRAVQGTYLGNGQSGRIITLPFTPVAAVVRRWYGSTGFGAREYESSAWAFAGGTLGLLEVAENGFRILRAGDTVNTGGDVNSSGQVFSYIAWR
jgi:hypothetical protein